MIEVWKPVPSLPGVMASSLGRIWLPASTITYRTGTKRHYDPQPTFGVVKRSRRNASHVFMGVFSRRFGNIKIHQAVCEAFHGPRPPGCEVLHLDEDGTNNRPRNLKWGTRAENMNAPGYLARRRSGVPK